MLVIQLRCFEQYIRKKDDGQSIKSWLLEQFILMYCFFHFCQKLIFKKFKAQYHTERHFLELLSLWLSCHLGLCPVLMMRLRLCSFTSPISITFPILMDAVHFFERIYLSLTCLNGPRTTPSIPPRIGTTTPSYW